jgi:hypothetical protein
MASLFKYILKTPVVTEALQPGDDTQIETIARQIDERARNRFGRSLHIREVDAGSCNGCELEIGALNNPYYDLERFGMHFVASPRHADCLLVTGPVTRNMADPLKRTYEATPAPKIAASSREAMASSGRCPRSCPSMPSCTVVRQSHGRSCWASSLRWRNAHKARLPARCRARARYKIFYCMERNDH